MGIQIGGEFIGFKFGDVHSSELGIVRVSDGSRYNENLLPTIQDKTVQIPGGDGSYYFGSYYTQRTFNISIAFDSVTEEQLNNIKRTYGSKVLQKLIFDEKSDRFYWVKSTGTPNLKYICFDEDGQNIYKGEGTLNFIGYDPFGYSVDEYTDIINAQGTNIGQKINNIGDLEADWRVIIKTANGAMGGTIGCSLWFGGEKQLTLKNCILNSNEDGVEIDSKTQLVYGLATTTKTGTIYNECLEGSFFKIPLGEGTFGFSTTNYSNTIINKIGYRFKYF